MKNSMRAAALASASAVVVTLLVATAPASDAAPWHDNCTKFNKRYPHGVGKDRARDHTSGTPVTTFKRSTNLYNDAMRANSGLDGDKDGIACEKA